jgi:hypothetical protein
VLLKYPEPIFRRVVTCSLMPRRTDSVSLPKRMMKSSKPRSASISGVSFFFREQMAHCCKLCIILKVAGIVFLLMLILPFGREGSLSLVSQTWRKVRTDSVSEILCLSNVSRRYRWPRAQRFTIQSGRRSHAGCCDPRDDKEISG